MDSKAAAAAAILSDRRAAAQVNDFVDDGTPADKHLRKIAIHVSAYITHIRTQLKQTIPKAIVHTLVQPCSNLQRCSAAAQGSAYVLTDSCVHISMSWQRHELLSTSCCR